jgi:SanA protein
MGKKRIFFYSAICLLIIFFVVVYLCNKLIERSAEGKLYADAEEVPFNKVGLLLGTAKYLAGGQLNPYYQFRIDAATRLFKAGKVKYLVVSGDNGHESYNEPAEMLNDLVKAGIDSAAIFPDYAGFRTFDSMVRLREVFSQQSVTVISQPFHNKRAIYIAQREGIEAIGYNARDVNQQAGLKVQVREKLARVKVFVDYLLGQEPKFLGEKVPIPD